MLPHALSSEACSLAPGVERLAVTAEIELGTGRRGRGSARFYRSRIRSDARLDYDQLDEIFAGRASRRRSPSPSRSTSPARSPRRWASGAARPASRSSRPSRSSASTPSGNVIGARGSPQTESHRLIERLMILTNEQVAELLERKRVPTLYRVHEQPDPARIERLVEQLHALGVPTPPLPERLSPRQAGEMAARQPAGAARGRAARARPRGVYIARAPLPQTGPLQRAEPRPRRARQPRLLPTSPRRSAATRTWSSTGRCWRRSARGRRRRAPREVREAAAHCSERERESARIERDADDVCAAFLLERELFERGWEAEFEGEVSGVIRAGAFVASAASSATSTRASCRPARCAASASS